jgi:hypothetical protein
MNNRFHALRKKPRRREHNVVTIVFTPKPTGGWSTLSAKELLLPPNRFLGFLGWALWEKFGLSELEERCVVIDERSVWSESVECYKSIEELVKDKKLNGEFIFISED